MGKPQTAYRKPRGTFDVLRGFIREGVMSVDPVPESSGSFQGQRQGTATAYSGSGQMAVFGGSDQLALRH